MVRTGIVILLILLLPTAAVAHAEASGTSGFLHGFSHPISGIDHVLSMIAVGVFAAKLGGRALWLLPLTFLLVMALAAGIGMANTELPWLELSIGLSIVILGLAIAFELGLPTVVSMVLVGVFALSHGYVHGAELPDHASILAYCAGFLIATAFLHGLGVTLALLIGSAGQYGRRIAQVGGGAITIAGVAILAGVL